MAASIDGTRLQGCRSNGELQLLPLAPGFHARPVACTPGRLRGSLRHPAFAVR